MRTRHKLLLGALGTSLALGLPSALFFQAQPEPGERSGVANASAVSSAFHAWSADHAARGGDRDVAFSLGMSKGFSTEETRARGIVRLDLLGGNVRVDLSDLEPGSAWDVWLVDNEPGGSAMPDPADKAHRLGRVTAGSGQSRLAARLDPGFFDRFEVDIMAVSRAGRGPGEGVLFGSPDLFQRLYSQGRHKPALQPGFQSGHAVASLASFLGPAPAFASPFDSLDPLVALGADVFQNEKFNGNGRTCGTCHPARNNFTIDPKFIAALPANDPLFVFETNPDLAQNLENAASLRQFGLVLENPDGFADLRSKFVLRAVPHTLAMLFSRLPQPGSAQEPIPPVERLGWGGDGAPGSGSLREFALGALTQHMTRRLDRTPGTDFRVPTDEELDAMAAFQLALGRQEDPDLPSLRFRSPVVTRGQEIYLAGDSVRGTVAAGKCNRCHFNGGANVSVGNQNRNFDVGIEKLPDHPFNLVEPGAMPIDGGFGTDARFDGNGKPIGFGNGRFNSVSVIEAADTAPFFHNNAVSTIEEAVDFYNSTAFNNSPAGVGLRGQDTGGIGIHLETTQVEAVAALLRILNALENIRSSSELDQAAIDKDSQQARMLIDIASFDTEDAFQVLEERSLHLVAVRKLKEAFVLERQAYSTKSASKRNDLMRRVLNLKAQARNEMLAQ